MRSTAFSLALACLLAFTFAGTPTRAGDGPSSEAASFAPPAPRTMAYFANYRQDPMLAANLALLVESCKKGYFTHVIVGLFHCDWQDRAHGTGATVSLNGTYLQDPQLQPLWEAVKLLQARGIKVIASFGGGEVGDYHHLLDPAHPEWYPPLRDMLKRYRLDGLDLDIEERNEPGRPQVMYTSNVRALLKKLRRDFGDGFILTSAPVASALLPGGGSMSPDINYRKLMKEGWFNWYNLQFYNGWGDVLGGSYGAPDYEAVLKANEGVSPRRFVAGVPTAPTAAGGNYHALSALAPEFAELAAKYPHFGGVYGWTYQEAQVDGRTDPVGWSRGVFEAVRLQNADRSAGTAAPIPAPAWGSSTAPLFTYQPLGPYPGIATAINANGDAVGYGAFEEGGGWHAFLVPRGGAMQNLETSLAAHGSQAAAVNGSGQVAGWAVDSHYDLNAFLKEPGQPMSSLGHLGGTQSQAWAVNGGGQAVGWSFTTSKLPHAFLKEPGAGMQDLGTLHGNASQATGINEKGQIVGWAEDAGGSWKAFYLPKAGDPMEPLRFGADVAASMATGLGPGESYEPKGPAVGWALMPAGFDAFLYNPNWEEAELFGTQLGSQAAATCINAHNQVTGWYLTGDGLCRAFVRWGGGPPQDLTGLVENPPPGDSLMIATGINDSGWIVGQTLQGTPFLLTPKP